MEKARYLARVVLVIKNYPPNFEEEEFKQLFGHYGKLVSITISPKATLIQFEEHQHASKALNDLNNMNLNGFELNVQFKQPKPKHIMFEECLDKRSFH